MKIIILLLIILHIFMLTGCGGSQEPLESHRGGPTLMPDESYIAQATLRDFSEFDIYEIYSNLTYGEGYYTCYNYTINEEYLDYYDDIIMTSNWADEENYSINAEIYKIKDINSNFMFAIKYAGNKEYYAFINRGYEFTSFVNLLNVTALDKYCEISFVKGEPDINCENMSEVVQGLINSQIITYAQSIGHTDEKDCIGTVHLKSDVYSGEHFKGFEIRFYKDNYAVVDIDDMETILKYERKEDY